ncbi:MAG: class I SAM-dependent methyltransferase [Atopobiaceae bacterium]|nr:class I SAM-dependent methyltransferase [Atopobiaceae bacterium]
MTHLTLREDERGLALVGDGLELRCDFSRSLPRLRASNLHRELLVRAARVRGLDEVPRVVDATAGLGEDSVLLAAAGMQVTLVEREPMLAGLLRDGLQRAARQPELAPIVSRMRLIEGDSIEVLASLDEQPHVVYLDPMFPAKRKQAATNKKLQLIQQLELPCANEEELLGAALAVHPRKVVIKRPLKGPCLAGAKPSGSLRGKVVRYDIVVP